MEDHEFDLSLHVTLLSGQSTDLRVQKDDTVNELRLQIQRQLEVKVSSLVSSDGRLLKLRFSKETSRLFCWLI